MSKWALCQRALKLTSSINTLNQLRSPPQLSQPLHVRMCVCPCEHVRTGQRSRSSFSTLSPLSFACQAVLTFQVRFPITCVYGNCVLTLCYHWNIISPCLAAPLSCGLITGRGEVSVYIHSHLLNFLNGSAKTEMGPHKMTDRYRPFIADVCQRWKADSVLKDVAFLALCCVFSNTSGARVSREMYSKEKMWRKRE